ncbi:hypothetical protein BAE44_0004604 [Dichanthelium oligosanthes]|uniref:Embryo surrounding factor 1 brassicaceae domain-containing protein n=1 Tax=Dichanthelium oligosanthes TaxID=888268 RepID=A0A1E5WAB5_9POAL|nr:hypothetical protein BAE44_0004604 [Dichanthelium oligosanthes]
MGDTSRMNVMVVVLSVVLFGYFPTSAHCGGDHPLLGEIESTRRNYTVATNHTLADYPNKSDGNSSKIVIVFCTKEKCRQGTCYCFHTNGQPLPCFESWDSCKQNCRRCTPKYMSSISDTA